MADRVHDDHLAELELVLSTLRSRSQAKESLFHAAVDIIARVEHLNRAQVNRAEATLMAKTFALRLEQLASDLETIKAKLAEERDGVLGLDAAFAEYLADEFGTDGEQAAQGLRAKAEEAWSDYKLRPSLFARQALFGRWKEDAQGSCTAKLGELVWTVDVKPDHAAIAATQAELEERSTAKNEEISESSQEAQPEKVPALASGVLDCIVAAFWAPGRRVKQSKAGAQVISQGGTSVATFNHEAVTEKGLAALVDAVGLTDSIHAHRLLRWLLAKVASGKRKVELTGGLDALARELGAKGAKVSGRLRKVLDVFQALELKLPDGEARSLLSWSLTPATRGKPARLTVSADDALLPSYVATMGKSQRLREAKRLVPVPMELPPLVGNRGTHGAQAALQILLLEQFRNQASEVTAEGYAIIPESDWKEMFRRVGLPFELMERILLRWVSLDGPEESFLWRDSEDPANAYRLGDMVQAGHGLVSQAGEREEQGRNLRRRSLKSRLKGS